MTKKIFVILFLFAASTVLSARTYYVDCNGDDQADAAAPQSAWKTLSKVSSMTFGPGDQILLRAGCVWTGSLSLTGSGTAASPILVDQYGIGVSPRIDGNGASYALAVSDGSFWEISHLEITNNAAASGLRLGVLIAANNPGKVLQHIYLKSLNVHNVAGQVGDDNTSKRTGGIGFEVRGTSNTTRFDDIMVDSCYVHDLDDVGIYTWTDSMTHPQDSDWQALQLTRVKISNNTVRNTAKNAIVVRASYAPVIEHNLVQSASQRTHGNAIYVFGSQNSQIQFNEVTGTKDYGLEGAAFDSDYNTLGTIIQYNFSHENGGGLVDVCSNPDASSGGYNDGTIVRYNISRNEGKRVIAFDGPATNTQIYNNTIFLDTLFKPKVMQLGLFGSTPGYADHVSFQNNIFYNVGGGTFDLGQATNVSFQANSFYGKHPSSEPSDSAKSTSDPMLKQLPSTCYSDLKGFGLQSGSPSAASGVTIPNNGGRDYFGTPIPASNPSRGAIQTSN